MPTLLLVGRMGLPEIGDPQVWTGLSAWGFKVPRMRTGRS
jgi:hypothetical protein